MNGEMRVTPLMETKIIQVSNSPSIINETNELWSYFGWNVQNVQITHSQDTRTYTRGLDYYTGDKTVETTTINYATITYQRDKNMPHYREFCELEREYNQILSEFIIAEPDQHSIKKILICLFCIWPLGLYYIYKNISGKMAYKEFLNGRGSQLLARKEEILRQAQKLIWG